jgi:dynein heavy chain
MKEAEQTPNVVEATNRPRLYDELEDIQQRLAVCEKALAEYLETKRLAFPRFYFISSSDLLDILSKGNQPVKVHILYLMHHACGDSVPLAAIGWSQCMV